MKGLSPNIDGRLAPTLKNMPRLLQVLQIAMPCLEIQSKPLVIRHEADTAASIVQLHLREKAAGYV